MGRKAHFLVVLLLVIFAARADASTIHIGGAGCISTSDEPYGSQALLDGGEVATATLDFNVTEGSGSVFLAMTVTNTSPAVLGSESPDVPVAPVIVDVFFSVPSVVGMMSLLEVNGEDASATGWEFVFDPENVPARNYGFIRSTLDGGIYGAGNPSDGRSVISSIEEPDREHNSWVVYASPVDFVMSLSFDNGVPDGFSGSWFTSRSLFEDRSYLAAAKFISGADGGSGTVTSVVPLPGGALLGAVGLCAMALRRRFRSWRTGRDVSA